LNECILPNQRGFFNFFDINISFNSGFGGLFFQLPLKQKNLLNNSQTNPSENIFLNQGA